MKSIEIFPPVGEFIIVKGTYRNGIVDGCDHERYNEIQKEGKIDPIQRAM